MDTKLHKYCNRYATSVNQSARSTYYYLPGGTVLRISDHYAKNSTGTFSIITPINRPNEYVIVSKSTGMIKVLDYEQVKTFVRSLVQIESFIPISELINPSTSGASGRISVDWLSGAQMSQIKLWHKQKFGTELEMK